MSDPKTKSGVKPFVLWRRTSAGLAAIERDLRKMLQAHGDNSEFSEGLSSLYLRVSDAADRKLLTELKVRQVVNELRDHDMREMTDEQLQSLLDLHARRTGLRNVSRIRNSVLELLRTPGADNLTPEEIVDAAVPSVPEHERQQTLHTQLNMSYARIEDDLDAGHEDLEAALRGAGSSEEDPCVADQETTTDEDQPSSDDPGEDVH